jgi:capsular exopolysaccharide synthesis family protein
LAVQYDILKKAFEANAQLYLMLLQRSKEAQLDNGMMGNNIIINSAPTLPLGPVSPKKDKILLAGIILGLLGGMALAVGLEFMDDTVRSSESIQQRLNLPILGAIPRIDHDKSWKNIQANGTAYEFVAHKFPTSPLADAVRIVQNTVTSHIHSQTGSVIAISSALPVEGKTFICVLMASVIASENKKVLIIDGDLRRPRVHEVFGESNEGPGLSELLEGKLSAMDEVIQSSVIPGLYYLKSGGIPKNPVALLKGPRIRDLIETCRGAFDYVLLDGPPLLGVADSRILAGYSDGMVLVTKAGHTPLEILRQAKESVVSLDGRLLGVVLNMADPKSESYKHYYYYPKYYKHYYHRYYQDNENG